MCIYPTWGVKFLIYDVGYAEALTRPGKVVTCSAVFRAGPRGLANDCNGRDTLISRPGERTKHTNRFLNINVLFITMTF